MVVTWACETCFQGNKFVVISLEWQAPVIPIPTIQSCFKHEKISSLRFMHEKLWMVGIGIIETCHSIGITTHLFPVFKRIYCFCVNMQINQSPYRYTHAYVEESII